MPDGGSTASPPLDDATPHAGRSTPAGVAAVDGALGTARAHLAALAREPRPAGSAAEARARAYAAGVLTRAGYRVREESFTYSAVVGRYGALAGGAVSLAVLLGAAYAGVRDQPEVAGAALLLSLVTLAAAGGWLSHDGVRRLPLMRRASVNLVAEPSRGADGADELPRVWLVAHLDSKSQPVAMTLRVAGVTALAAAWVGALALAAVHGPGWLDGAHAQRLWPVIALLAVFGAIPVMLSVVGARSAGALDNASGVASVLVAAEELAASGAVRDDGTTARTAPVGVLLTSAEELALAGAHAWATAWAAAGRVPGVALNCDGVDDRGPLTLLRGGYFPYVLQSAVRHAAPDGRIARLPPGVLVDAVALGRAGWDALTVSKGSWRTLGRIHTRRDTLARLAGDGVPEAAGALARLARLLAAAGAD